MNTVKIKASRSYDVCIGSGLIGEAGSRIKGAVPGAETAAVISDDTVFSLYGKSVLDSLEEAGFRTVHYVFHHGESSKTIETFVSIISFLADNHLSRSDVLVALGGGVVGDVTGFAAATYKRGAAFVQIPTTLLADVDASVGGKTAVDLSSGKNLLGSFWQPSLVLCDTDALNTLPEDVFRDGCAEVIKYGVLGSRALFDQMQETPISDQLEDVIISCVEMKRDIVYEDEFDMGRRQLLNLGHSFGHAVEVKNGYSVSHGSAVAIGMCMMARAAADKGFCSTRDRDEIIALIEQYGLPSSNADTVEDLLPAMLLDKKTAFGRLNLIVPERIGRCRIESVACEELTGWLKAGGAG